MDFESPPQLYNQDNNVRKAGFEFEFAGIEFEKVADIIVNLYGGKKEKISRYIQKVRDTEFGDFKLEFDSRVLKEKRYESFIKDKIGLDLNKLSFKDDLEDVIASVSSHLVPFEVILPPVPFPQLGKIEMFREKLLHCKAIGTTASPFFAFAFHINPEIPDEDTKTLTNYLKAFALLQFWLFEEMKVNFTRRHFTSFINFFPNDYLIKILQKDYNPDIDQLIADYREFNPTRNRPLDMYPIFVYLKGREILKGVENPDLVNGRPAFHYRLPDCLIDDPEWRLPLPWNGWVEVEKLGEDTEKMNKMIDDFNVLYHEGILNFKKNWIKKVKAYIR